MSLKKTLTSVILVASLFSFSCGNLNFNVAQAETIIFNNEKSSKLDSLFNTLLAHNKFMGSVTLSKANKVIYNKAFGFASVEDNLKASTETKYRIGSVSKMFTSVMIFQLIEEKKLTLATKLATFFPEIKNADKITVENLLHHSSGIASFTNNENYLTWFNKPQSRAEMLKIIVKEGNLFEPNQKHEYSNSNYVLLGYLIEEITKKAYAENLKERITTKINLKNTYFGKATLAKDNEAFSYTIKKKEYVKEVETDMSVPHGAGAIVSTPNDLSTFITALFKEKLITKDSLEEMKKIKDGYGKGIFEIPFYDKKAFGHNGKIDEFNTSLAYFPQDDLAIAFTSNQLKYSMNTLLIGILSIYYDFEYKIPSFSSITVSPEILKSYEGIYSAKDFPLKITIKVEDEALTAQATGQPSFALEAVSENQFKFDEAGIKIIFSKEKQELNLLQGMGNYTLKKE